MNVATLDIPCPVCGAESMLPCISVATTRLRVEHRPRLTKVHRERWNLAVERERAELRQALSEWKGGNNDNDR